MSMKKATNTLKAEQVILEKLNAEKSTLTQQISTLQAERSTAVRALAGGDQTKRKLIVGIEAKIASLSLDLEAVGCLIVEATEKVSEAKKKLEEAQAERERELTRFIADREKEEFNKLLASLPERKQRILDLYTSFLGELGEFQVDAIQFIDGTQQSVQEITDFTARIQGTLHEALKAKGLRPLMMAGYGGQIPVWSHIRLDPDIAAALSGRGILNALEIAKARTVQRKTEFAREFEGQRKG